MVLCCCVCHTRVTAIACSCCNFLQTEHLYSTFVLFFTRVDSHVKTQSSNWLSALLHTWHLYGFSPLWILLCTRSSYMAGHVVNPSTKFEDPTAIHSWVMSSDISQRIPLTGEGRSLAGKISGGRGRPPTNILIPLERQLNALKLCRWQFLYNETLQQTFRPSFSKSSKIRQL